MDLRDGISLLEDPVWTDRYDRERERVEALAADGLAGIEHVGSTAIPDVPGKPALDVLVVYEDWPSLREGADALATDGYELHGLDEDDETGLVIDWREDHAVFLRLHVAGDEKVATQLLFRDYLRDHEPARRRYEAVKRDAAADHPDDPGAYTAAKSEVVSSILADARAAGYDEDLPAYA